MTSSDLNEEVNHNLGGVSQHSYKTSQRLSLILASSSARYQQKHKFCCSCLSVL